MSLSSVQYWQKIINSFTQSSISKSSSIYSLIRPKQNTASLMQMSTMDGASFVGFACVRKPNSGDFSTNWALLLTLLQITIIIVLIIFIKKILNTCNFTQTFENSVRYLAAWKPVSNSNFWGIPSRNRVELQRTLGSLIPGSTTVLHWGAVKDPHLKIAGCREGYKLRLGLRVVTSAHVKDFDL